jgi:DNA-binding FrmR family transcriptional regulator
MPALTREESHMELPEEVVEDLRKRLRRVVAQLTAATRALEQAGFKLIASGLVYCLDNPEAAAADGYAIDEVQRMFMKLA